MSEGEFILDREVLPTPSNDPTAIRRRSEKPALSDEDVFTLRVLVDAKSMNRDQIDTLMEMRSSVPEDDEEAFDKYTDQIGDLLKYRKQIIHALKKLEYY